jgi:hypothetical protein
MKPHWSILLPAVQVVIALIIMMPDEVFEWHDRQVHAPSYERYDEAERLREQQARTRQHRRFARCPSDLEDQWGAGADYWPGDATKAMYAVNLPASLLVGWYSHAISLSSCPLLWPVLGVAADAMPLRTRIIVFDLLFVTTVALQWWLMGKILDAQCKRTPSKPLWASPWGALTLIITCCAIFCALLSPFWRSFQWVDMLVILAILPALGTWMAVACLGLGNSLMWCYSKVRLRRQS